MALRSLRPAGSPGRADTWRTNSRHGLNVTGVLRPVRPAIQGRSRKPNFPIGWCPGGTFSEGLTEPTGADGRSALVTERTSLNRPALVSNRWSGWHRRFESSSRSSMSGYGSSRPRSRRLHRPSDDYQIALWRLRIFASEAVARWPLQDEYERFQLLALVDAHDAVVDSGAALVSGMGAPAVALLRRAWELSLLLTALWRDPEGTLQDLRAALENPRRHDNLAPLARVGAIGAVMPHPAKLRRRAGFARAESLDEVERGLKSVAHGGVFSTGFYQATDSSDSEQPGTEAARAFLEVQERTATLTSAAASMISERLGFQGTDRVRRALRLRRG